MVGEELGMEAQEQGWGASTLSSLEEQVPPQGLLCHSLGPHRPPQGQSQAGPGTQPSSPGTSV